MKKSFLLTAAGAMALGGGLSAATPANALSLNLRASEQAAYQAAKGDGSVETLQSFLTQYPDSAYTGEVFGDLVQKVAHTSRGYERSGNPKAAGGPANPGRGRGVNGHY